MKRALLWRFALVVALLAGAVYSLFPLQNRDFLETFEKLAAPKMASLAKQEAKARVAATELEAKLNALSDKTGPEGRKLQAQLDKKKAEATTAGDTQTAYGDLVTDARTRLEADKQMAPYAALKQASKGDATHARAQLCRFVDVPTQPNASNDLVLSYVRRLSLGKFRLGLDLRGGTEFVIGFDPEKVPTDRRVEDVRDQILEILRNRVDALGVAEPEIKPIGPTSISLRMPSISEDDKADIRRNIMQTARLEFHMVHKDSDRLAAEYQRAPKDFVGEPGYIYKEMEVMRDGQPDVEGLFIKSRAERVKGENLERAAPNFNEFGSYSVSLRFDGQGTKDFAEVTTEHVQERMAIILDDKLYSAPVIREPITGGSAEISGSFTLEEAHQLAVVLQCGKLPVSIEIDSEFGTDPTLGSDSIKGGVKAAVYSSIVIMGFMLVYYRLAGVVSVLALVANTLFLVATMALTGATITLPGIAGIVLSVGMAVDASVLINERIREEIENKKTLGNAIHAGFDRAFVTILDANMTTLITGLILFKFGSGSVKGFAVTLSIGLIANMFTAVFMSRTVFDFMLESGMAKKMEMMQFFRRTNINFLAVWKPAIAVSVITILATFMVLIARGADSLSIDFRGGTAVIFRCTKATPDVGAVRKALEGAGNEDCNIGYKYSGAQDERLLEVVQPTPKKGQSETTPEQLLEVLRKGFPEAGLQLVSTNRVGGLVGAQFQQKAVLAMLLSWVAIVLYVAFRFELSYGLGGVLALVHDVIISAGVCLFCGRQFSLPVLAALLTIIGYSINDTIVIFDRIRENLTLMTGKPYREIINLSVNQTLSRTVLTNLCTLFSVLALFVYGGSVINDFSLVMLAGMISGTYSTVFIAGLVVAAWHKKPTTATSAVG